MREYKERIREVEHADFNPLVFTTVGAMGPQSQVVMKRIAEKLSDKKGIAVSVVTGWLRVRLSFALLRTSLLCLRGTRHKKFLNTENVDLAVSQARCIVLIFQDFVLLFANSGFLYAIVCT